MYRVTIVLPHVIESKHPHFIFETLEAVNVFSKVCLENGHRIETTKEG